MNEALIRDILGREADKMSIEADLPAPTARRARRAELRTGALGLMAVAALLAGVALPRGFTSEETLPPVGPVQPETLRPVALSRGKINGDRWVLSVNTTRSKGPCLRVRVESAGHDSCYSLVGDPEDPELFEVFPGTFRTASYVVGRFAADAETAISLESGGTFVPFVYDVNESFVYFARFFPTGDVAGVISMTLPNGQTSAYRFHAERTKNGSRTGITREQVPGSFGVPGFEHLPGDKFVIDTGSLGAPGEKEELYDLVLRLDDGETCLHLEGRAACTVGYADTRAVGPLIAHRFGSLALVGGLVHESVGSVVVSSGSDGYPAQLRALPSGAAASGRFFVVTPAFTTEPYTVTAYDSDGDVMDEQSIGIGSRDHAG